MAAWSSPRSKTPASFGRAAEKMPPKNWSASPPQACVAVSAVPSGFFHKVVMVFPSRDTRTSSLPSLWSWTVASAKAHFSRASASAAALVAAASAEMPAASAAAAAAARPGGGAIAVEDVRCVGVRGLGCRQRCEVGALLQVASRRPWGRPSGDSGALRGAHGHGGDRRSGAERQGAYGPAVGTPRPRRSPPPFHRIVASRRAREGPTNRLAMVRTHRCRTVPADRVDRC